MADKLRRVDYYYVHAPDRPGEGHRILSAVKEAGVNLLSMTAFPDGKGQTQIDFVTENPDGLAKAVKGLGLSLSPRHQAFFIQGSDRPGAVAEYFKKLADAGVNIHAANAACAPGGYGMILWVKPENYPKAAKALGV
jgi:hypothetical protein